MNNQDLINIIENTNAMLNRDGLDDNFYMKIGIQLLNIPGVRGYFIPIDSENVNHVGLAQLNEKNVDSTVQKVIEFFKSEKKSFSWIIGPGSEPKDLPSILEKHGFYHMEEMTEYGMVLSTESEMNDITGKFSIEEVRIEDLGNYLDLMVESFGFGMNRESAMSIVMLINAINSTDKYNGQVKAYLAKENDTGKQVGFCYMTMDRDKKYAILDGSGVIPSYRRRGIYRAMISRRSHEARENGIKYLIIHAMKNTSAGICEKVGFKKICQMDFYGYKIES